MTDIRPVHRNLTHNVGIIKQAVKMFRRERFLVKL